MAGAGTAQGRGDLLRAWACRRVLAGALAGSPPALLVVLLVLVLVPLPPPGSPSLPPKQGVDAVGVAGVEAGVEAGGRGCSGVQAEGAVGVRQGMGLRKQLPSGRSPSPASPSSAGPDSVRSRCARCAGRIVVVTVNPLSVSVRDDLVDEKVMRRGRAAGPGSQGSHRSAAMTPRPCWTRPRPASDLLSPSADVILCDSLTAWLCPLPASNRRRLGGGGGMLFK